MNKVLYITRNGLLEPLGQSQVMPYLRGLSSYYKISLITKPNELISVIISSIGSEDGAGI